MRSSAVTSWGSGGSWVWFQKISPDIAGQVVTPIPYIATYPLAIIVRRKHPDMPKHDLACS